MRGAAPTCCLVAPTGPGVEASIRRHVLRVARTLHRAGWKVHVLWSGAGDVGTPVAAQQSCERVGADCTFLEDFVFSPEWSLAGPNSFPALRDSDRARLALERLHEQHCFDLIEFPDHGGLGFRTIQAKQSGQSFADVPLLVTMHGPTAVLRHERQQWLARPEELALDHAEQYAFEHADGQVVVWSKLLAGATALGWEVRPDLAEISLDDDELLAEYQRWLHAARTRSSANTNPLVTVGVAYYNLGALLEETLESLVRQCYENLDVVVINDGSTDGASVEAWRRMPGRFPQFRFVEQTNHGIGATRNRGLAMARGDYFLPMDADNVAHPDMVHRLVQGLEHDRGAAAMTCYFLAFLESSDLARRSFAYAFKPTGGPRVLGCLQNVYGDGNALFRTAALRAVGGFSTDRDTSFEDWEVFVKLVNSGRRVEVLPDFLFYYRHRDQGFSRATNGYRNHQRVLRRYVEIERLPAQERTTLWNFLVGSQDRVAALRQENAALWQARRRRWRERFKRWISGGHRDPDHLGSDFNSSVADKVPLPSFKP